MYLSLCENQKCTVKNVWSEWSLKASGQQNGNIILPLSQLQNKQVKYLQEDQDQEDKKSSDAAGCSKLTHLPTTLPGAFERPCYVNLKIIGLNTVRLASTKHKLLAWEAVFDPNSTKTIPVGQFNLLFIYFPSSLSELAEHENKKLNKKPTNMEDHQMMAF